MVPQGPPVLCLGMGGSNIGKAQVVHGDPSTPLRCVQGRFGGHSAIASSPRITLAMENAVG